MPKDVDRLFEEANNFFYKNDYSHAMELFEEILKIDSSNHQTLQKMAKIESTRGNWEQATKYLERSLDIIPNDANAWNELGNVYFDQNQYNRAIECYKKSIEIDSEYYWAYYNIGISLIRLFPDDHEKRHESRDWFKKSIALKPDYHPALNELGVYYMEQNDYSQAENYFIRCIEAYKSYKYPYYNLSTIYKDRGETEKAKELLYTVLSFSPDYLNALNSMGILYYRDNDYPTALYFYTLAIEKDAEFKYSLHNIGLVFDHMELYRKAYEVQKKVIKFHPDYQPAIDERDRLERERPEEIKNGEALSDKDLKSVSYAAKKAVFTPKGNNGKIKTNDKEAAEKQDNKNQELFVEKFGRNLTKLASQGKLYDILGRDKEIQAILEILFKIKKNNPVIVGRAGVGKTAIVEGLALKIVSGDVPEFFKKMQIIEVNMGMLVAGTKYRGEFEIRLKKIMDEIIERDDIILFIDEFHNILGAGATEGGTIDAANIMKPALARGEIRCIGATTADEYKAYIQKDAALDRRFYKVTVEELGKEATTHILKRLKPKMEKHYGLSIEDKYIDMIVELADQEIKNRVFPDKAIDIFENVFSRCALSGIKEVDELTVKNIVGEFVGIKFIETEEDKGRQLLLMESYLKERIFGQDKAIDKISKIIRLNKQKLDLRPEQPDGVFFFAGPTGVGKTFLAKQLAMFLFGSSKKLFTLNMSEFTESHSVSKLLGSPPGYVGYNEVSFFHSKITENPSCLLLLDEIEKAHPEVLKIFLQIFDEGKITDSVGHEIWFSNVTIIMTSNALGLGSGPVGFASAVTNDDVELTKIFPPEFVNRIDEVIIFDTIDKPTARRILEQLIVKSAGKIFEKKGIEINFNSTFLDYILELGYSLRFGVRNLERSFEKEVMSAVANYLFEYPDAKKLAISADNGRIQICAKKNGCDS
ncbi:MAG: AAA family ATPase [Spirochaetales bacterium]|nr:AAA family ATPase [Spirochaetales bacterium]